MVQQSAGKTLRHCNMQLTAKEKTIKNCSELVGLHKNYWAEFNEKYVEMCLWF